MRILVCGGRAFKANTNLYQVLDRLHAKRGITCIVTGGAEGVDTYAQQWAWLKGIPIETYAAPLDGRPDGVVAFPGRRSTANLVRAAQRAGLKVWMPMGAYPAAGSGQAEALGVAQSP